MSPGWPVPAVHHAPPARAGTRGAAWGVAAGAVAVVVGAGFWLAGVGGGTERASRTAAPVATDFRLGVKVLHKRCDGDGGCEIEYRVQAGWSRWLDPARTYQVRYEIRGAEGPAVARTLTVTGDSYRSAPRERATTGSRRDRLEAVVTSVVEIEETAGQKLSLPVT
jgi:hypothetical protein